MFSFNPIYFFLSILLFVTEVLIALYLNDGFIRPYFGDFLVVMLIYCFVKSFANIPVIKTTFGVLLFFYFVELTQYFKLVKWLGLQHSKLAVVVLGNAFAWTDMVAYTLGIGAILLVEWLLHKKKSPSFTKNKFSMILLYISQ